MRYFPRGRGAVLFALVLCVALLQVGDVADAALRTQVTTTRKSTRRTVPRKAAPGKTAPRRVGAAKTVPPRTAPPPTVAPTTPAVTTTIAPVTTNPVPVTEVVIGGNPGAVDTTIVPTASTTTLPNQTTTTAPYPAGANPPSRATAATLDPYRGLGTWLDAFDWTVQKGKAPKVSAQTVDAIAAAGVQTIYIQASRYDTADVSEPERLLPIIGRAHELGLSIVVWYLPTLTDVNADLRRTVAIANLDVDGISIDVEARNVSDVAERNRRLISYSQSLRSLLPGRLIANNIVQPNVLDAVPNQWPTVYGQPPAGIKSYWTPFPYVEIAPFYDLWMIQSYWTQRSAGGGWRDAYKISVDNVARLRATLGRPDLPIHLIGGVGDKPQTPNDLAGLLKANGETGGIGLSFYDWLVTPPSWWPTLWNARSVADPRFAPVAPPPYVAPTQPVLLPPATTFPSTIPTTAPPTAPTVPPTVPPVPSSEVVTTTTAPAPA